MGFSYTGLSYLILFFTVGFLAYRFFQYWRQKKDKISRLFFYFAFTLCLFAFTRAVSGLFFADNIRILKASIFLVIFFESIAAAIAAYITIFIKMPKISPWLGFFVFSLLGAMVIILTYVSHPYSPFLDAHKAINWQVSSNLLYDVLRFILLFIPFFSLIVILIQQFKNSKDSFARTRAIGLSCLLFLGIIIGLLDFFLIGVTKLPAISRDIVTGFLSILLFVVVFLTQKSPRKGQ